MVELRGFEPLTFCMPCSLVSSDDVALGPVVAVQSGSIALGTSGSVRGIWGLTPVGRRRGACGSGPFPAAPGPNRTGTFRCIRLSSDFHVQFAAGFPWWMAWWQRAQTMSVLRRILAIWAAQAGCSRPGWLARSASLRTWWVSTCVRVWHHSHSPRRSRVMISFGRAGRCGLAVGDDRFGLPFERDAAEPCGQWFPARPFQPGLEAGPGPVRGDDHGPVLAGRFRHRGAVLRGERLEHGQLGGPPQPVQPEDIPGEQVVLDDAPVFRAVDADDLEVVQVQQVRPVPRGAVAPVGGLLGRDHVVWNPQPDAPVDAGPGRRVLHDEVVAEEPGLLGAAVGDQRLGC